jgi:hypothetical protein
MGPAGLSLVGYTCTPRDFVIRWWGKPVHRLHLLYEDDSAPPSVDYWGVDTPVVDVRRLSDSLVGYTCTPRDFVTRWWGKPVHLCQLTSLEECSSQGFVRVGDQRMQLSGLGKWMVISISTCDTIIGGLRRASGDMAVHSEHGVLLD